jgi:hypothetical protein
MNERQKRLKEVYEHARTYFGIHTQGQFADAIGYSRPVISSALNGDEDKLTDKLFKNIDEKFPGIFNLDYLLNGKGNLLTTEEGVAKANIDERIGRTKPEPPAPTPEVPNEMMALLDRALSISRRNEEMVERLVSATSQNRQTEIAIENVARHLNESQQQVMQIRADILTATDAIHTFRATVDTIRDENERLKASNELLGQRLNKAAALFADLNTKVAHLLHTQEHRYPVPTDTTHQANEEPNVYPNK